MTINRPGFNLRTAIIQCTSMFVLIFTFLRWGVSGVALGVVSAFAIGLLHNLYLVCRRSGVPIKVRHLTAKIAPPLLSASVMAGVVEGLKQPLLHLVGGTHNVLSLGGLVMAGILSYGLVLFALKRSIIYEILELLQSAIGRGGKHLVVEGNKARL